MYFTYHRITYFIYLQIVLSFIISPFCKGQNIGTVIANTRWIEGPSTAKMGEIAEIEVPNGYSFANGYDTRRLMESMGNPPSSDEVGLLCPNDMAWFIVFGYENIGFVKDDEKDELDADKMLEMIKESTEKSNEYREKKGVGKMYVIGWEFKPQYNQTTHNLEWAIKGKDDYGNILINHNTKLLGRKGVINAVLVVESQNFLNVLPIFRDRLNGFSFQAGQKYAEYREGDKIAEYGLTALIVGGGAAVAAKSGLFKYLWKILVVAFLASFRFIKNILIKIFRKGES